MYFHYIISKHFSGNFQMNRRKGLLRYTGFALDTASDNCCKRSKQISASKESINSQYFFRSAGKYRLNSTNSTSRKNVSKKGNSVNRPLPQ